jgi:hypothetical protein
MKHWILVVCMASAWASFAQQGRTSDPGAGRDSLAVVVSQIAANNKYESQYVGFAGSYSQQHRNFERLIMFANDQDLLLLVRNKNAAVRVYSFKALMVKNRKLAASMYEVLRTDGTPVFTLEGCIGGEATVGSLIGRFMVPAGAAE